MPEIKLEHHFDRKRKRHYLNDQLMVLHCHHYATLFTQLAIDAKDIVNGTKIMFETAEDIFNALLQAYYKNNGITTAADRIDIARQLFSRLGMGTLVLGSLTAAGGQAELPHAYLDEGWLKKWGRYGSPVNFIGAGYLAGMMAAVYDKPSRTYRVIETQSVVMGAGKSIFHITT